MGPQSGIVTPRIQHIAPAATGHLAPAATDHIAPAAKPASSHHPILAFQIGSSSIFLDQTKNGKLLIMKMNSNKRRTLIEDSFKIGSSPNVKLKLRRPNQNWKYIFILELKLPPMEDDLKIIKC
jgi:hypothetical protein